MKNPIKSISIILTVCLILTLSSCCKWCKKDDCSIDVDITHNYIECPAPIKPIFKQMSSQYHIGGKKNLDILDDNLLKLMDYNERLINTLECYQNQSKPTEKK